MSDNTKQRISILMAVLLIGAAFLVDGLQAFLVLLGLLSAPIPGVDLVVGPALSLAGSFLGIAADICFMIWFFFLGVSYTDKGALPKLLTLAGMTAITLIPGLDILPELTVGVIILIVQTRMEDSAKGEGSATATGGGNLPQARLAGAAKIADLDQRRQEAAAQVRERQQAANDNQPEEERAAA